MKVLLTIVGNSPAEWTPLADFRALAAQDRFGVHTLTDSVEEADAILFVDAHMPHDWRLSAITAHLLARQFPEKTLLYNDRDRPWCVLPGLYVSMPQSSFDPRRQAAVAYYKNNNNLLNYDAAVQPELLFSFMGSRSYRGRTRLLNLTHPRAYIEDTTHTNFFDYSEKRDEEKLQAQKVRYQEMMLRSKFILCPRGTGVSSFRLQEALMLGRVPVIISDEWTPPVGIDWDACALRVREADVDTLPALLEAREADFPALAARARQAYEDRLAPDVFFHHLAEQCRALIERGACAQRRPWLDKQYLRIGFTALRGEVRQRLVQAKSQVRRSKA